MERVQRREKGHARVTRVFEVWRLENEQWVAAYERVLPELKARLTQAATSSGSVPERNLVPPAACRCG